MKLPILTEHAIQIDPLKIEGAPMKVEYWYNKQKDITEIMIWEKMRIIDRMELPGIVSERSRKKITEEILKKVKAAQ